MPPPFALANGENGHGPIGDTCLVYTVGHGNQEGTAFIALLRQYGIATLVDVRSAPYSRYVPHFSQRALCRLLDEVGVRYLWSGDTLGGRPSDPACYRDGVIGLGNVDYERVAAQVWYQEGVAQLIGLARCGPTAVMCSEEDPRRCHRRRLIEPSLREQRITVAHIRADGGLETIETNDVNEESSPQLTLHGFA